MNPLNPLIMMLAIGAICIIIELVLIQLNAGMSTCIAVPILFFFVVSAAVVYPVTENMGKEEYAAIIPALDRNIKNNMSDSEKLKTIESVCKIYTINTETLSTNGCIKYAVDDFIIKPGQ